MPHQAVLAMLEGLFVGVALLTFLAVATVKFAKKKCLKQGSPFRVEENKVSGNQVRPGFIVVEPRAAGTEHDHATKNGGALEPIPHVGVFERSIGGQCFKLKVVYKSNDIPTNLAYKCLYKRHPELVHLSKFLPIF